MTDYEKGKTMFLNKCSICQPSFLNNSCRRVTMLWTALYSISVSMVRNMHGMFSFNIPIDVSRSQWTCYTDSDLETWKAKHSKSCSSAHDHHQTICVKDLSLWSGVPSSIKVMFSRRCSSARLRMTRFCNILEYLSPVTLTVSKSESHISSKRKSPITVALSRGDTGGEGIPWLFKKILSVPPLF